MYQVKSNQNWYSRNQVLLCHHKVSTVLTLANAKHMWCRVFWMTPITAGAEKAKVLAIE